MAGDVIDINKIKQMQQAVSQKVTLEKLKYAGSGGSQPPVFSSKFVLKALHKNEDGDAFLLKMLFKDRLCYDHAEGKWLWFNANFWEEDLVNESINAIEKVIEVYGQEVPRQAQVRTQAAAKGHKTTEDQAKGTEDNLLKRIKALHTLPRKKRILELAASGKKSLGISGTEWDSDPWLLGCSNGVIDLKSGNFRPGRASDYLRKVIPTEWQGIDVPAPRWEQFILEIFDGNQDLADFIQRLFGYAIIGKVIEHIFPIMWGRGRNGKGTLIETLNAILGEHAGPLDVESIMEQRFTKPGSAPSPDIMSLRGRRICWASESEERRKLSLGKVKWLVGGDSLTGREVFGKRQVTFTPAHTLFLLTNYKPKLSADDYAAWERIYLIPFALSYVDNPQKAFERKKDGELPEKLLAEAPGILAWLIKGCLQYQERGLNPPDIVLQATQEYREEEDDYKDFLVSQCVISAQCSIKASDFYQAYISYCEENFIVPKASQTFYTDMTKKFDKKHYNNGNYYKGVELIKLYTDKEVIDKLDLKIL